MYNFVSTKGFILISCGVMLTGCASLDGTVVPLAGGEYRAISLANNKKEALKIAAHDAEFTCEDEGGAYEVISQESTKDSDEVDLGNPLANAAVSITKFRFGIGSGKVYEVNTKFKCKKAKKTGWF